ncbi:MAG: UDP-N-acetylmuramate--L-alanine ligase [Lachnospiraceae bacterium]|nr:UDP-N-acetylmuramate--L-alanine ligase [Lachnospiraceae bacterium]
MYQIDFHHPIRIYFMGIGGISMSGLAEVVLKEGFTVSGSDNRSSALTDQLASHGAQIFIPQMAENITDDIDLIVYTAAIHPDNPEWQAAVEKDIPMLSRAEFLGQLMDNYSESIAVAGTHGKTTTTAMLAHILLAAEADPTISIGGMLEAIGGNIRVGGSGLFITEACEYTNSFLHFHPKYNIILNIEEDHLDFFEDLDEIRRSFRRFAGNTLPGGVLFVSSVIDHPEEITAGSDVRVVSFGINGDEDYSATQIACDSHACPSFIWTKNGEKCGYVSLQVPGRHNVKNALAAIACTAEAGYSDEQIINGLQSFTGAARRFEFKGMYGDTTVIDDYAHHPTEIRATLQTALDCPHERVVSVFQPHTYSRTKLLWDEFVDALSLSDVVILTDVYAARETDTLGVRCEDLAEALRELGTEAYYFPTFKEVESFLSKNFLKHDMLITLGAGDVYQIGEALLSED